jgi:hypothetical protein
VRFHDIAETEQRGGALWRLHKARRQNPVRRKTHRLPARSLRVGRFGDALAGAGVSVDGFSEQVGARFVVVRSPSVVKSDGQMKHRARLHVGARQILLHRQEQGVLPFADDGFLGKQRPGKQSRQKQEGESDGRHVV